MDDYTSIPGFEHIYLEDSYVLAIDTGESRVAMSVDLVLLEGHDAYVPPDEEQYCYRRASLVFEDVDSLEWRNRGELLPATDASGESDLGSIDELRRDGHRYIMRGDFGELEVTSANPPSLDLEAA